MKRTVFSICLLVGYFTAVAGDGEYAVNRINSSLLKNANAVVRIDETRFRIKNPSETVLTNHFAITILNEKGDNWAIFSEYYNKHRRIESIEGYLYDANGKQIKKIKKKDTEDLSGVDEGTLMDDSRIKKHNFYYKVYPYTIEYTVEINNESSLFFPMWAAQPGENISVEKTSMEMVYPLEYKLRYKTFNYKDEALISTVKNEHIQKWEASDLPAIVRESYSPRWHDITTVVIFGPSQFQIDNYEGNMVNWQDFGKFIFSLKEGKDQLPDDVKKAVHSIADGLTSNKLKIEALYKYLQDNTRYISIQLGIGGWQPFDAREVASKRYGDCKALTNYMYSLLKEAGIPSYYTLIRAGRNERYITEDFPSQQFNHVILCAPLQKDTIWLECTNQTVQAGYLGAFTANRTALLVDESGGKLVRTPVYKMNDNVQSRSIKGKLEDDATLHISSFTKYTGLQQDDLHHMINDLSATKVKEILHEQLDFATYNINSFNYEQEKGHVPVINETLDISASNYATITGKRLFIIPNTMTRWSRKLSSDSSRKYDIELGYEYIDIDSVEIDLPAGYESEALPQPVQIVNKFGKYSCSVKITADKMFYYRKMEHYSGHFPASDYNELVKFYEAIYKADRSKVVLVKN